MATHEFPVVLNPAQPNYIPEVNGIWMTKCHKYHAGHAIHFIQARLAGSEEAGWQWEPATIMSADGYTISFVHNDVLLTHWNHDPYLLQSMAQAAAADPEARTEYCVGRNLLRIFLKKGAYMVYLSPNGESPCSIEE